MADNKFEENKKRLYDFASKDFDLGDFNSFTEVLSNETDRRALYDAVSKKYEDTDFGDWDSFNEHLGYAPDPSTLGPSNNPNGGDPNDPMSINFRNNAAKANEYDNAFNQDPANTASADTTASVAAQATEQQTPSAPVDTTSAQPADTANVQQPNEQVQAPLAQEQSAEASGMTLDPFGTKKRAQERQSLLNENMLSAANGRVQFEKNMANLGKTVEDGLADINNKMKAIADKKKEEVAKNGRSKATPSYMVTSFGNMSAMDMSKVNERTDEGDLFVAKLMLEDAQKQISQAEFERKQDDFANKFGFSAPSIKLAQFFVNFHKGGFEKAIDPTTWDFGYSSLLKNQRVFEVCQKMDKGEDLTEGEQAIMDAATSLAMARQGYDTGWGFSAGETATEMIPFMLQIASNPVSGASGTVSRATAKYFLKKVGYKIGEKALRRATTGAVNFATGAATDLLIAGPVQAVTTGAMQTGSKYYEKRIGDIQPMFDKDGKPMYAGRIGAVDEGEAMWRAIATQSLEYSTENLSTWTNAIYLPTKVAKKLGANKIFKAGHDFIYGRPIERQTGVERMWYGFKAAGHTGGILEEYSEEVLNNAINVALGEMEAKDFWDVDSNIETLLGVAMPQIYGGTISGISRGVRNRKYRKAYDSANTAASAAIEGWDELKAKIDGANENDFLSTVKDVITNSGLTPKQRRLAGQYVFSLQQMRGEQEAYNDIERIDPTQAMIGFAHEKGQQMSDPAQIRDAFHLQTALNVALAQIMPEEDASLAKSNPLALLDKVIAKYGEDSTEARTIVGLVQQQETFRGVLDAAMANADKRAASFDASIDAQTHKDGNVYEVITSDGATGYVVDGDIQTDADGVVDRSQSAQAFMVYDPTTKKSTMMDGYDIMTFNPVTSADALKQSAHQQILDEENKRIQDMLEIVQEPQIGQPITINGMKFTPIAHADGVWTFQSEYGVVFSQTDEEVKNAQLADYSAHMDELMNGITGYQQIASQDVTDSETEQPAEGGEEAPATEPEQLQTTQGGVQGGAVQYSENFQRFLMDEPIELNGGIVIQHDPTMDEEDKFGYTMTYPDDRVSSQLGTQQQIEALLDPQIAAGNQQATEEEEAQRKAEEQAKAEEEARKQAEEQAKQEEEARKAEADRIAAKQKQFLVDLAATTSNEQIDRLVNEYGNDPMTAAMQNAIENKRASFEQDNNSTTDEVIPASTLSKDEFVKVFWTESFKSEDNPRIGYGKAVSIDDGGYEEIEQVVFLDGKPIGFHTMRHATYNVFAAAFKKPVEAWHINLYVSSFDERENKWDGIDGQEFYDDVNKFGNFSSEEEMIDFYEKHKDEIETRNQNAIIADELQAEKERKRKEEKASESTTDGTATEPADNTEGGSSEQPEAAKPGTVGDSIKQKWSEAKKIVGFRLTKTVDGKKMKGHYVLVDANAVTPSHDPNNGFKPVEGFPTDENGQTVNDRDYMRSKNEQQGVIGIAQKYDGQALDDMPVVSTDGVALSGNKRTMASQMAAANGTDSAYIETLNDNLESYGFEEGDLEGFEHPRVVFVLDDDLPYNAATFALFNKAREFAQDAGSMMIKLGKILEGKVFNQMMRAIDSHETLSEAFNDESAVSGLIKALQDGGVMTQAEYARFVQDNKITDEGKNLITRALLGKILEGKDDLLNALTSDKNASILQSVTTALPQLAANKALNDADLRLIDLVADSIKLAMDANAAEVPAGGNITAIMLQADLLTGKTALQTTKKSVVVLATLIHSNKSAAFREFLSNYNDFARKEDGGQTDIGFEDLGELTTEQRVEGILLSTIKKMQDEYNAKKKPTQSDKQFLSNLNFLHKFLTNKQTEENGKSNNGTEENGGGRERADGRSEGTSENQPEAGQENGTDGGSTNGNERGNETKPFELTIEILETADLGEYESLRNNAIAYLNGDKSQMNQVAYLAIQDYVRSNNTNAEQDSSDANGTQLGSEDNVNNEPGTARPVDGEGGRVDSGDNGEGVPGNGTGGTDSTGDVASGNGAGSDSGVHGGKSAHDDGASSNGSSRGGVHRGKGSNGKPRGRRSSNEVSGGNESGNPRASAKDGLENALGELSDILKEDLTEPVKGKMLAVDPVTLYSILGMRKTLKVLLATAKVSYYVVKCGYYEFKDWFKLMKEKVGGLLSNAGLSDEQVDGFIEMMWDFDFEVDNETHKIREWASILSDEELRKQVRMSIEEKRKLQKEAEGTETILGDIANIRESLPFLLPKQQEDVQKAERQFYDESHADAAHGHGKGYMFTNGTGTGKTYTGLGIVKRFIKRGKGRILIVTAQETKIKDWIRDAQNLGIEATMLENTISKGSGVVVTQYANMRQNRAILEDEFDLIVYDESHKIMENMQGNTTSASIAHHMLSNRDVRQAIRRTLMAGEFGQKFYEAQNELDLLETAEDKPSSEWTDEVRDAYNEVKKSGKKLDERIEELKKLINEFDEAIEKEVDDMLNDPARADDVKKARESVKNTKVVFLSATPFNVPANLDYAEGYIFSYTNNDDVLTEKKRLNKRDDFLIETFAESHKYSPKSARVRRMEMSQISDPIKASEEEVKFSDHLQDELETMSGRNLDNEYDYSREFPKLDLPEAAMFNDAIQSLTDGRFNMLKKYFSHLLGGDAESYHTATAYLEIFKAQMIAPRIREYLALGKKVTVYHRRKASNQDIQPPFAYAFNKAQNGTPSEVAAMEMFKRLYEPLFKWEQSFNFDFPQDAIFNEFMTDEEKEANQKALQEWTDKYGEEYEKLRDEVFKCQLMLGSGEFAADHDKIKKRIKELNDQIAKIMSKRPEPKCAMVEVFNGTVKQSKRRAGVEKFNDDASSTKIFVAQVQSAKEGISLHDTTGKFPRVQIALFQPTSSIEFIQTEGRIFRVGNKSNAIFEYPMLGLDIELNNFAAKINGRSETTENLALGSKGRGLRESILRSALASRKIDPKDATGVGGKELDNREAQRGDGFIEAVKNYDEWRNEAKPADVDKVEIPDPIGYMMTKWSNPGNGERILVPNARRGSIARYVPRTSRMTVMETNNKELARLNALVGGGGRKVIDGSFREHSTNNKYDIVVMNTGHGVRVEDENSIHFSRGDSADAEWVAKAAQHLEDSGRVVALVRSEVADEVKVSIPRNISYYHSAIIAEIKLPAFVLNGTPSSIIIFDRVEDKTIREQIGEPVNVDLSDVKDENELFNKIKAVTIPERKIDKASKIVRRLQPMATIFKNTGLLASEKSYSTGKMEPKFSLDKLSLWAKLKKGNMTFLNHNGDAWDGFYIRFDQIVNNNPLPISDLAKDWAYQKYLLEMSDEDLYKKFRSYCRNLTMEGIGGVRACVRAFATSIELALDKTPLQLRNIAAGKVENEVSGSYDLKGFREVFDSLNNDNAEVEALADKVFDAVSKINGITFSVKSGAEFRSGEAGHNVVAHYVPSRNAIELNGDIFNSIRYKDDFKAQTVVHEMIHAVTCWAIATYKQHPEQLTKEQQQACKDILEVYKSIEKDDAFRRKLRLDSKMEDNAEYGLTNEYEMMAELANPIFRAALKAKKLWRQLINGIKMLLGMESEEVDALSVLDNALETLMNTFDSRLYQSYVDSPYLTLGEEVATFPMVVTDKAEIERLNNEPQEVGYRNVVLKEDGSMGSPMGSKLGSKGKSSQATAGFEMGSWEQSDEHPELATENGKINLIKPDGTRVDNVDYNPYIHIRPTLVNKQFKQAWERPDLVYIRTAYPSSELTSGFKADKAKKSVGMHDWNGGKLILSRWDKPLEIVPWEEVADDWEAEFKGKGIPFDIIPPKLLPILAERGIEILPPHKGMGEDCFAAYENWKNSDIRFRSKTEEDKNHTPKSYEERLAEAKRAGYTKRQFDDYLRRSVPMARKRIADVLEKLGLTERTEIIDSAESLDGKKKDAKGFFNPNTGKITIVLDNHSSLDDVMKTILHEGVAHFGLRNLLGEGFDDFLDAAYNNSLGAIRYRIIEIANKNGLDRRTATEEYLASLAEDTNYEDAKRLGWWSQVYAYLVDMLRKFGFADANLTDNELRYVCWLSYNRLKSDAEKTKKLNELVVNSVDRNEGEGQWYDEGSSIVADNELLFRNNDAESSIPADSTIPKDIMEAGEEMAERLNSKVHFVDTEEDIPNVHARRAIHNGESVAYYDIKTGEVYVYLPHMDNANDARKTVLHEILGHKGLREVAGAERYDELMQKLYENLPKDAKGVVFRKMMKIAHSQRANNPGASRDNRSYLAEAMDEWLAEKAELADLDYNPSFFQKVIAQVKEFLRDLGLHVELTDNDVKYMLWRSYMTLHDNGYRDVYTAIRDMAMRTKFGINKPNNTEPSGPNNPGGGGIRYRSSKKKRNVNNAAATTVAGKLYYAGVEGFANDFKEAYHDELRSVRELQNAVTAESGNELKDSEDAYTHALIASSKNQAEWRDFYKRLFEPTLKAIKAITDKGVTEVELEHYMNAVHGLERNDKFAMRDAEAQVERELAAGTLADADKTTRLGELYAENREKDYSGLTSIFYDESIDGDSLPSVEDAEQRAINFIADFDARIKESLRDNLWKRIDEMRKFSLTKSYNSGLISRATYEKLFSMFEHYIPLRGWREEDEAEDIFGYSQREASPIQATVKEAKGRKSEANNIIATLANMAHSAIVQGNKNQVGLCLLRLAEDNPSKLLTVGRAWYEKYQDPATGNEMWRIVESPDTSDMNEDDAAEAMADFEETMRALKAAEPENYKEGRASLSLNAHINPWNAKQHQMRVLRNGKEYIINLNGNPSATQALNGLLTVKPIAFFEWAASKPTRALGRVYTSWNPEFMFSNLQRDFLSALQVSGAKYGAAYTADFAKNVAKMLGKKTLDGGTDFDITTVLKRGIFGLYQKYEDGKLDMSNPIDKMFHEFIMNGGETGYSQVWKIDKYQKEIEKAIKSGKLSERTKALLSVGIEKVEWINQCVENICRFSAYMASRNEGRSILQSVYDAKEVSVNFNRKGSGAMGNAYIRGLYAFTNAGIQGLAQRLKLLKDHPRAIAITAAMVAAGFLHTYAELCLWGMIMGGDGDDDDKMLDNPYMRLSDFRRWNSFDISFGNWALRYDLSHEDAALFGLGCILAEHMMGYHRAEDLPGQMSGQFGQLLPVDIAGNELTDGKPIDNLVKGLAPTAAKPLLEAYAFQEDFLGRPINNQRGKGEIGDNRHLPESRRIRRGDEGLLNGAIEMLNQSLGGTRYKRSWLEKGLGDYAPNASNYKHIASGYFGGLATFPGKVVGTVEDILDVSVNGADPQEKEWSRTIPLASRVYTSTASESSRNRVVKSEFQYFNGLIEKLQNEESAIKSDEKNGWYKKNGGSAKDDLAAVKQDEDYKYVEIWTGRKHKKRGKTLKQRYDANQKALNEAYRTGDDDLAQKLETKKYEIMREAVTAFRKAEAED